MGMFNPQSGIVHFSKGGIMSPQDRDERQLDLYHLLDTVDISESDFFSEPLQFEDEELEEEDPNAYIKLADAMLVETIRSAFGLSRGGRKAKPNQEAKEWIFSEHNDDANPFSFNNCCKATGLDPDELRENLRSQHS